MSSWLRPDAATAPQRSFCHVYGRAGAAGWPEDGTFHSLRHYFATTLITQGVDPTDVQRALRHSSLRITLETYVHWWPKAERRRSVIGAVLTRARDKS